jgi:hypothetical protein
LCVDATSNKAGQISLGKKSAKDSSTALFQAPVVKNGLKSNKGQSEL